MNLVSTNGLKLKIYELTKNKDIYIKENERELIVFIDDMFYMYITFDISFVTIRNYNIAHKYRGTGFGSNLYNIFEEYLKSCEYKEIQLHLVLTDAEKFWKKKGFIKQEHIWRKVMKNSEEENTKEVKD